MKIFHCVDIHQSLPESIKGGVVAIGNFDGLHRGHCLIIKKVLQIAKGRPTLILTFEPHPRTILKPHSQIFKLSTRSIKVKILKFMGLSALIEYQFSLKLAACSAEEFVTNVLVKWLKAKQIVIGIDFQFGKEREGNGKFLQEKGLQYGFEVTLVNKLFDNNTKVISSSNIRNALENGLVDEAANLLGYRFTVESEVIYGQKLGRKLGYPTANMQLHSSVNLKKGVYAVRFRTQEGISYGGVASFGYRPTVIKNGVPLLETFVFDFSQEIYQQICAVSFFDFLRSEIKFDNLNALVTCMRKDEERSRTLLENRKPLNKIDRMIAF
ncbi:Riboflavin kinase / FMN adenylyltransferase [Liberibacter crescens BT-1]|uniref:Riboflavin biosynthesis protein n=1 Tax=Liberibacter crescens (strain BT-1) TaxID=1215343 RepID=L0EV25_LIBCB|nr:bifunctional riboflavin kinase/FAD synthetase [Liberibacter crescens]AGA64246.1 Riboflavin kinase / FMN adenylyltransferase [Liberibacter crescens BT-1]AMC12485.1 riboflavin kinase [Liberibacter crescens]